MQCVLTGCDEGADDDDNDDDGEDDDDDDEGDVDDDAADDDGNDGIHYGNGFPGTSREPPPGASPGSLPREPPAGGSRGRPPGGGSWRRSHRFCSVLRCRVSVCMCAGPPQKLMKTYSEHTVNIQ